MKKIFLIISLCSFAFMGEAKAQLSLRESYQLAQNDTFQLRVKVATVKHANDVLSGENKVQWLFNYAQLVILEPTGGSWIAALSHGVTANPAITNESSDADIQYTVNTIFEKYARAYYRKVE